MNTSKRRLNKIVALTLLVSAIMMPVTALITHVLHERGAEMNVQAEKLLFLTTYGSKISHICLHIHVLFGIIFVVASVFHVIHNWRTLKFYLSGKSK